MPRYKLLTHPEANLDLAEIVSWYKSQQYGIAERFLTHFFDVSALLEESPLGFQMYRAPYRKVSINRFPYGVFYYVENEQVMITGVFHSARDPNNIFNKLQQRK